MHSIFLSHTSVDKPFARSLALSLRNEGVKVWIDEAEIMVGDSLIEKIRDGIDNVAYVGVILSPEAVKSTWVQKEVDVAMNQEIEYKKIKVIPILYKACDLPGFLIGKKYADFTTGFIHGFIELMNRLTPNSNSENHLKRFLGHYNEKRVHYQLDLNPRSVDGAYQIKGTNHDGTLYQGTAEIISFDDGVTIVSYIANKVFVCRGMIKGKRLIVSGDFDVTYEILANGQIIGIWDNLGTETLIPHLLVQNHPLKK